METNALLTGIAGGRPQNLRAADPALRVLDINAESAAQSRASEKRTREAQDAQSDPPPLNTQNPVTNLPLPAETNVGIAPMADLTIATRLYAANAALISTPDTVGPVIPGIDEIV